MCVDEIIPDYPKLELEAMPLPWGKSWERRLQRKVYSSEESPPCQYLPWETSLPKVRASAASYRK